MMRRITGGNDCHSNCNVGHTSNVALHHCRDGAALNLSCATAILALSIALYWWVLYDNKRRDQVDAAAVLSQLSDQEIADLDYKVSIHTDDHTCCMLTSFANLQHPNFRWTT